MYSAIKINGKKLYELARKGREVERQPRAVRIDTLWVLEQRPEEGTDFLLRVECSKGTYVRTLCHDIGQALGCGGCMSSLRRVRAAGFTLDEAVSLEEVLAVEEPEKLLLPVDQYFTRCGWGGKVKVRPDAEKVLRCGGAVGTPGVEGEWLVYAESGEFLGLGTSEGARLRLTKSFFEV